MGDGIPHPAGSAQNKIVRQRIVDLLTSFGYEVELQERSDGADDAVPLTNILARLPGSEGGPCVMLASHYDSVPAGPGACDDGVGTAALLEIARMLKSESQRRRDIVFLITDGEEMGMLGAAWFVAEHPWAKEIGVAINLEARGTSGPSLMFETSEPNGWLISLFAKKVRKPFTSSLFFEVYRYLPNDTDFTRFKQGGMQGYNFAFIGDVKNYHRPSDNFENADRGSLQHHGDNALALVRALADDDIENRRNGNSVYFDFLGWTVIHWPAWLTSPLTIALFGFLIFAGRSVFRRSANAQKSRSGFPVAFLAALSIPLVVGVCGWALHTGFRSEGLFEPPWIASAFTGVAMFWLAGLAVVAGMAWIWSERVTPESVWIASWIFWGALALLIAWWVPGASYLFVVPLLAAAIAQGWMLVPKSVSVAGSPLAFALPPMAVAAMWLPLERMLYDAIGFKMGIFLALRIAIVLSPLAPAVLQAGRRTAAWLGSFATLGTILCAVATLLANR